MDNYIVRIIRRNSSDQGKHVALDGVVESAEGNSRHPFHNIDELWNILGNKLQLNQNAQDLSEKGREIRS